MIGSRRGKLVVLDWRGQEVRVSVCVCVRRRPEGKVDVNIIASEKPDGMAVSALCCHKSTNPKTGKDGAAWLADLSWFQSGLLMSIAYTWKGQADTHSITPKDTTITREKPGKIKGKEDEGNAHYNSVTIRPNLCMTCSTRLPSPPHTDRRRKQHSLSASHRSISLLIVQLDKSKGKKKSTTVPSWNNMEGSEKQLCGMCCCENRPPA